MRLALQSPKRSREQNSAAVAGELCVVEFPHVARPAVARDNISCASREILTSIPRLRLALSVNLFQQGIHQGTQVALPFTERWQLEDGDGESVEKILAELPAGDPHREIAIGGGDHTHIDLLRITASDWYHLGLLEHAQQLHLHLERQLTELVEENGAAFCFSEVPAAHAVSAGEGSLDVTEELTFYEVRRNGAAVDGDELPLTTPATAHACTSPKLMGPLGSETGTMVNAVRVCCFNHDW